MFLFVFLGSDGSEQGRRVSAASQASPNIASHLDIHDARPLLLVAFQPTSKSVLQFCELLNRLFRDFVRRRSSFAGMVYSFPETVRTGELLCDSHGVAFELLREIRAKRCPLR